MAYTKQNWECGDLITADKMNHIEDGIEDASSGGSEQIVVINFTSEWNSETQDYDYSMDKTCEEVRSLLEEGKFLVACMDGQNYYYMDYYRLG